MQALPLSSLVFVLVFGGALAGMAIRRVNPDERYTSEAKDTIRIVIGLVVTMTGLVLGMLVSSGKTFYDAEKNQVAELSAQVILINDLLTAYGPEAGPLRVEAHNSIEEIVDRIWPEKSSQPTALRPATSGLLFYQKVRLLEPKDQEQASVKAQLLTAVVNLRRTYWLMFLQSEETSITFPLLAAVTSWLLIIFFSFGLFAPRLRNVFFTLFFCALAVSSSIFIILSLNAPFTGVLKISPAAVRDVLSQMDANK